MAKKYKSDYEKLEAAHAKEKESNEPKYLGLELSEDQERELVTRVLFDIETDEKARQEFLDKVVESNNLYEGQVKEVQQRFEGEVHVSSRVATMTVETLHSILYPTVWNEDLQYWTPVSKDDIQVTDIVNKFMDWETRFSHMAQFVDDYVKCDILEGTVVTKVKWNEDWEWRQVKLPNPKAMIAKIKSVVKQAMTGKQEEIELEPGDFKIEYEPVKEEYCSVDIIPLEDVGFPPFNDPSIETDSLDHIWHRTHPFLYEIQEREDRGFVLDGSCERVGHHLEEILHPKSKGTTEQRMSAEGSQSLHYEKYNTPLDLIEWYGRYEVEEGCWEEIVVWVEQKSKQFLGATYLRNISKRCKRPFDISQFIRRPGRLYGISAVELVKNFQFVLDEMLSINVNAAKMAVYPPGFYRAASGFDPEKITVQPGIMIPVDDINDAKWVQIPNNVLPTSQEMKFILDMVEKITSIGAYQTGQESSTIGTRATARGTMALISQGERRFAVLGKRLQYMLAKILKKKLEYYQENMSPKMLSRVLGQEGEELFPEGLTPYDIMGEFNVQMSLDATGGSKSVKMQQASEIYGMYMQNPLTQQDPSRVWEVSSEPLKEAGHPNLESIIGPRPPSMQEQQQMQAEQQQQMGAGSPSVPPPSPGQPSPEPVPTEPAPPPPQEGGGGQY